MGWALGKMPKLRYQRATHLLLLQPQSCPCLAGLCSEAWKNSARTNPAQQLHLASGAAQAISPVLTEEAELKQGCGNKSCCPDEVMSPFQGLGGSAADKLAEMGAMQVPRQFYFFSSKTVPAVGACSF